MKRFTFVFTLALLARLNVSAGTVPISANYSLLGSQWSDNETFIHYTTGYSPFSAENDDQILSWHVITQQFFPADAYFHVGDPALNGWYDQSGTSSDLSPLPRGYAFFYFRASTATSFTPPLISPVTVVPKTLQSPNAIYFLSSQLAVTTPGSYQDLVGGSTVLNNRTFVWTWDAAHQTFGEMFRFRTGSGWKRLDLITLGNPTVAAPSVPAGLGAVVGWFQGGPAPCLLSVVDVLSAIHAHPNKSEQLDPSKNRAFRKAVLDARSALIPENFIARVLQFAKQGVTKIEFEEYDTDWNSKAYYTVSGQNSNNSIRITNEFMRAVDTDGTWNLFWRTEKEKAAKQGRDPKPCRTLKARDLWDEVATAAWNCADPGVQYDTTINEWHTCPAGGRINASNPCSEYMFLDDTACNLASLNLIDRKSVV